MRVLVISNYKSFHTVRPEAEIFLGLAKKGVEVHIMTQGESEYVSRFKKAGITVVDFHPQKKRNNQEIAFIREYLITHEIDILQLFNNKAIYAGIPACKNLPVKLVLYRGYTGNMNKYDPTAYLKHLHPRVDAIICNSQGVKEYLDKQLPAGNTKTVTINKGHDVSWYKHVSPYIIRKELKIPHDAFLLVTTANNRPMKGIPYLLQAIHHLPQDSNVYLVIIGAGMNSARNIRIIKRGRHFDKIHLVGHKDNALEIVKAADAFILASVKGESITKSVIEAMAMGVPAIITDIPGNTELVNDGESGIIVKSRSFKALAQGILDITINKELCEYLGKNAKIHISEKLSSEKTIEQYYTYYSGLLQPE